MRDAAAAIIREVGVETGGSNIQFGIDPETGRMVVIEMNPRVSRSSALASKATGFPIAKIAAKLAVGMTLDEIPNDITRKTPSCFEPSIDYVVAKIPKFQFEKFPGSETTLTTQMKSVGEVMAIGRTFQEALCKAIRSLEPSTAWRAPAEVTTALLREKLHVPGPDRIHWLFEALERGMSRDEVCSLTKIDPWFIRQMEEMVALDRRVAASSLRGISPRAAAGIQALRRQRRRARQAVECEIRVRARPPPRTRRHPGLQARGHLRRGIRILHAVPLLDVRGRRRIRRRGPPQDRHPRQRPEPHRAGNRIRLLLLPRRPRAQGRRLRDRHGQLQSRNGLDRLRHLRPPLLRAAHPRRRARRARPRKAAGRDRAIRRSDSPESRARAKAQPRQDHRHRSRINRSRGRSSPLRRAAG